MLPVTLRQVCNSINKRMDPKLIIFPSSIEELKEATNRFENKFGIPQVIGCIDGTHIPIKKPLENSHDYYCYKQFFSLNYQAICDEKGFFVDVEVRWPGSVHDARMFHNCEINQRFRDKEMPPFYKEIIPGHTPVPPLLLGDPNLMKEYSSIIENKQINFNNRLRTARNQIEFAFGRLKGRWRILGRTIDLSLDMAVSVIYTCFVLHNFCEKNNIEYHGNNQSHILNEQRIQACSHHNSLDKLYSYNTAKGKQVRDGIDEYLYENEN